MLGRLLVKTIKALGVENKDINLKENNIFINKLKICGMAAHIRYDRSLVHASILVESNLERLRSSLKKLKYPVINLTEIVNTNINSFIEAFRKIIQEDYKVVEEAEIKVSEVNQASNIYLEKYTSKKWNIL